MILTWKIYGYFILFFVVGILVNGSVLPENNEEIENYTRNQQEGPDSDKLISEVRNPTITMKLARNVLSSSGFFNWTCSKEFEVISDPDDCSKYYLCISKLKISKSCKSGMLFNKKTNACDSSGKVNCSTIFVSPKPMSTTLIQQKQPASFVTEKRSKTVWPVTNAVTSEAYCPCAPKPPVSKNTKTTATTKTATARPTSTSTLEDNSKTSSTVLPDNVACCSHMKRISSCAGQTNTCGTFHVVCYFTNWAWYRADIGKFKPENIDPTLCTHVIYAFTTLKSEEYEINIYDPWADVDNGFYAQISNLSQYGVCSLVAIGGWTDSSGSKYSVMCNDAAKRAVFIKSVIAFLNTYDFCGIDIDWEYPTCPQGACGYRDDKACFVTLLEELKAALRPYGYILTVAVSANPTVADKAYDIPAISKIVDVFHLMTYDFFGSWNKVTGHNAPITSYRQEFPEFSVLSAIEYWIRKGASRCKLTVGIPTYGRSFTLESSANTSLSAPARAEDSAGEAGPYTKSAGYLAYYEICYNILHMKWTVVEDKERDVGTYAYYGNQWVGYDNEVSVIEKTKLIREYGLGGAMIWALDLDDFRGTCFGVKFPLLRKINTELCRL